MDSGAMHAATATQATTVPITLNTGLGRHAVVPKPNCRPVIGRMTAPAPRGSQTNVELSLRACPQPCR